MSKSNKPGSTSSNTGKESSASDALLLQRGVIHDVRQMLAVVAGRAELMKSTSTDPVVQKNIRAIGLAAHDAAEMLSRLEVVNTKGLIEAEVETGSSHNKTLLLQQIWDVAELIQPSDKSEWKINPRKSVTGRNDSKTEPSWELLVDVDQTMITSVPGHVIREVLNNLFLNALAVMPDGGQIQVTCTTENTPIGDRISLTLQDNGPGVSIDQIADIFVPGCTNSGDPARGIGLPASRQLLEVHGASLALRSDGGPGAGFVLNLPAADPGPRSSTSSNDVVDLLVGKKILVVDDELSVLEMMVDVLTELGQQVVPASDAESAQRIFGADVYDLVIIDHQLPGQSGLELAADLHKIDSTVSIVVVSGWGNEDLLAAAEKSPAVDYTARKPLAFATIRTLLSDGITLSENRRTNA